MIFKKKKKKKEDINYKSNLLCKLIIKFNNRNQMKKIKIAYVTYKKILTLVITIIPFYN